MTEVNYEAQLSNFKHVVATEINTAYEQRNKAAAEVTGAHVWPSSYVNLMKANIALKIYGMLQEAINYCENEEGFVAEETLRHITRMAQRHALSSHRINSTCNVVVEVETMERLEWVCVYNILTTGSKYGI